MPGLLEPFLSQIWISVRGWGRITGLGFCAFDLGSGIGEGGKNRQHVYLLPPLDQARQEFASSTKVPNTDWLEDREDLFGDVGPASPQSQES